jgi:hypothetical protein
MEKLGKSTKALRTFGLCAEIKAWKQQRLSFGGK